MYDPGVTPVVLRMLVKSARLAKSTVMGEVEAFRARLKAEVIVPTSVVLSQHLNEICRQELELFARERGPLTREQDQLLRAFTAQIGQKIASSLAREIKELPTEEEQERLAAAAARLFRLDSPRLAGTKSEPEKLEPKERVVASNYELPNPDEKARGVRPDHFKKLAPPSYSS